VVTTPPLGAIEVVPATPERWDDVVTVLGRGGDVGCWCQAPRGLVPGGRRSAPGARRAALREQLADVPPPGMLAYVDGEVAGWCGFGPRPNLPRLVGSRTIPAIDDRPVWSILCFNVRVGYRRRGVAAALLDGVIELARRSGAPGVEAYPIDPERGSGRRGLRLRRGHADVREGGLPARRRDRGAERQSAADPHAPRLRRHSILVGWR
jgi:GNAT superfamily N-acetyltransferase